MSRPPEAAAKSSGASSLAAVAYQKSPSVIGPLPALATSVSDAAVLRAPDQVRERSSGDQCATGRPVEPLGSKHETAPQRSRQPIVSRTRSVFTLVATTGPCHRRMAGTANPVVFLLWVGPKTTTDCDASAASVSRPDRPRTRRPSAGGRYRSNRRSPGRAHRAGVRRSSRRCRRAGGAVGRRTDAFGTSRAVPRKAAERDRLRRGRGSGSSWPMSAEAMSAARPRPVTTVVCGIIPPSRRREPRRPLRIRRHRHGRERPRPQ